MAWASQSALMTEPTPSESEDSSGPSNAPLSVPMARAGAANAQVVLGQIMAAQTDAFTGPIPSPAMLDGYARVDATLPERLVAAWENETAHRQEMERREMTIQEGALEHAKSMDREEMGLRRSGQNHSTVLVGLLLILGGVLAYMDKTAVAITIFSSTIIALAVIYVLRKFPDRVRTAPMTSEAGTTAARIDKPERQ